MERAVERELSPLSIDRTSRNRGIVRHVQAPDRGRSVWLDQEVVKSMEIRVVRDTLSRDDLREIAKQQFGDMVKDVVDVEQALWRSVVSFIQTKRRCY